LLQISKELAQNKKKLIASIHQELAPKSSKSFHQTVSRTFAKIILSQSPKKVWICFVCS